MRIPRTYDLILYLLLASAGLTEPCKKPQFKVPWLQNLRSAISANKRVPMAAFTAAALVVQQFPSVQLIAQAYTGESLQSQLETYNEELESINLRLSRDPKNMMDNIQKTLTTTGRSKRTSNKSPGSATTIEKDIADARERVLTLKAYLDEAERDLFKKNWDNLQVYIYTFAEQEDAFITLIDNLFPMNDELDKSAREALSFEAKSMFLALEDLREAAKDSRFKAAQRAYSRLLLAYVRFLKAGDLYPTYDPFTSTEVFFKDADKSTLRFDSKSKVQVLDSVVLTEGPDMGKRATVILIDGPYAVIKLDKDGKAYQEVKYVKLEMLAKDVDPAPQEKKKES